jgi:hypothetical protein
MEVDLYSNEDVIYLTPDDIQSLNNGNGLIRVNVEEVYTDITRDISIEPPETTIIREDVEDTGHYDDILLALEKAVKQLKSIESTNEDIVNSKRWLNSSLRIHIIKGNKRDTNRLLTLKVQVNSRCETKKTLERRMHLLQRKLMNLKKNLQ